MKELISSIIVKTPKNQAIKTSEYLEKGKYPVIDQGENYISGYSNNDEMLYNGDMPVILFGDHTRCLKLVKEPFIIGADGIKVLEPNNKYDKIYFYYAVLNVIQNQLKNYGYERHFKYLKQEKIESYEIDKQKKIAKVLSNYDDLIENNTKRIDILEDMAKKLYKEWFVDFKFPGHENIEFKTSELGNIPSDWNVLHIGDIISTIESGSRPKGGINPRDNEIPSIGAENILGLGKYDYSKEKYISLKFFEKMKKGKIQNNDVLLYKDGAKLGRKSIFGDSFPYEKCVINEHVFILRCNTKCSQYYLYFTLDTKENTDNIIKLNANAAQPGINQEQVKGLKILVAPMEIIRAFDLKIASIVSQIFNLCKKNRNLQQTRDMLLPRLMSGEIDVEDLEIK